MGRLGHRLRNRGSETGSVIGKRLLISMKLFTNASRGIPLWTDISLTDNDLDAGLLISVKLTDGGKKTMPPSQS